MACMGYLSGRKEGREEVVRPNTHHEPVSDARAKMPHFLHLPDVPSATHRPSATGKGSLTGITVFHPAQRKDFP